MSKFVEHAIQYAKLGFRVFPLAPNGKTPLKGLGWKNLATTDEAKIRQMWTASPDSNIGLACGVGSSVCVVDVDYKNGLNGYATLADFKGQIPITASAYTPSGGCHLYFRTNPEDMPNNKQNYLHGVDLRGESGYVVLPPSSIDGKLYTWRDKFSIRDIGIAELPEVLRPVVEDPIEYDRPTSTYKGDDAYERAKRYIDVVDGAVEGQSGQAKLFETLGTIHHGFELSIEQVERLFWEHYNHKCDPPWENLGADAKEVKHKLDEIQRKPMDKPRGWLLNDPEYAPPACQVDIKAILESEAKKTEAIALQSRINKQVDDSEKRFLLQTTGLAADLAKWIDEQAVVSAPWATMAAVYAFLGTLFGRKLRDESGLRTNMYIAACGASTSGKCNPIKQIRNLMHAAGCSDLLGGDDIASDSAIEVQLEAFPSSMFMIDELGQFFAAAKNQNDSHRARIFESMMKIYSAADSMYKGKAYADEEKQRELVHPCLSVFGCSTREKFHESIDIDKIREGWLSRWLVVYLHERGEFNDDVVVCSPPAGLVARLREWWERPFNDRLFDALEVTKPGILTDRDGNKKATRVGRTPPPEPYVVKADAEAKALFRKFRLECEFLGGQSYRFQSVWGRALENAKKLAIVIAGSENFEEPVINERIVDYSTRYVKFVIQDMIKSITEDVFSDLSWDKAYVTEKMKMLGGVNVSAQRLLQSTRKFKTSKQRNEVVGDMVACGMLIMSEGKKPKHGYAAKHYTLVAGDLA